MTPANPPIHTLVFDWGDTLMKVFPQFTGPMHAWPEVAVVPGAPETLLQLRDHYNLVVATNAAKSSSHQVRQALERVGMGAFFSAVFTFSETDARKPDAAFFQAIQASLGLQPAQLCKVGDSYQVDVLGAWRAGWLSAWYNPSHAAAPGLVPLQDMEIDQLALLPAALAAQDYPGYAACLVMLQQQSLSFNILAHVHAVAAAAYQLALWLRAARQPVDPLLAHRGGLLHDLAKGNTRSTNQPCRAGCRPAGRPGLSTPRGNRPPPHVFQSHRARHQAAHLGAKTGLFCR